MDSRMEIDHRPWPPPRRPWIMEQTWHDLLFAHWSVPAVELRARVPGALRLDTFDGQAWVGIVPFRMSDVHLRSLPPLPPTAAFPELNVRTYVVAEDKPGVYFFSLDAGSPLTVAATRLWYHLPYFRASMSVRLSSGWVYYRSHRTHRNASPANLSVAYRPTLGVYRSAPGTLEHWLTERYCLYAADRKGRVYRADIHHSQWPLQSAEAIFYENTMAEPHGLRLPNSQPLLHYARQQKVLAWSPERLHL